MQKRNLIILVFCQLISATGSIVFVTLGPIIGANLTANQAWSTLPVSLMVVAVAVTTVPATMLMRRVGRRYGFASASASAIIAVCAAIWALRLESFAIFLVATLLFGINMAFTQQYRYAAAESVPSRYVPRAISFVLVGSIGGAIVGPELVKQGQLWVRDLPYVGTMIVVACLYFVQVLLFMFLQRTTIDDGPHVERSSRALLDILRQPVFLVAVLGGTAGYGLMTLVMTATPLSMNINDGYSIEQTSDVKRAHVLGCLLYTSPSPRDED